MAKVAVTKKKKKTRRKHRSLSEKIWIFIALLLAFSMVASSLVAIFR